MTPECMVIANELGLYREVLAGALGALRPDICIQAVPPDPQQIRQACDEPRLVISTDDALISGLQPFAWILLYPDDTDLAVASIAGKVRSISNATITDLLAVIDEAWTSPRQPPESLSIPAAE